MVGISAFHCFICTHFPGLIHCQLLQGDIKDAALQLELLDELLPTIGASAVSLQNIDRQLIR